MSWQPIEYAPLSGEFLAEDQYGDWIRVERFNNPFGHENTVISPRRGKWWRPKRWMPLPAPPAP